MKSQLRSATLAGSILDHPMSTTDPDGRMKVTGVNPLAEFILDDGTVLRVEHEGDHLEVYNLGKGKRLRLGIITRSGNMIEVHPA